MVLLREAKNYVGIRKLLTCAGEHAPLLLVSFSLSKATMPCEVQSLPEAGESGWMYRLCVLTASPGPATAHSELIEGNEGAVTVTGGSSRRVGLGSTDHRLEGRVAMITEQNVENMKSAHFLM